MCGRGSMPVVQRHRQRVPGMALDDFYWIRKMFFIENGHRFLVIIDYMSRYEASEEMAGKVVGQSRRVEASIRLPEAFDHFI